MIAPGSLNLVPDESAFSYLPSPWLDAYCAATTLGVSSLLLVVRELVRESGLSPSEREATLDDFLDRARELARRWVARQHEARGALVPADRIERLLQTHAMALGAMQSVLDDFAAEHPAPSSDAVRH